MAEKYTVQTGEYLDDEMWESYKDSDYHDLDEAERILWSHYGYKDPKTEDEALELAGTALKTYRNVRIKKYVSSVVHTF
jgi:hypothetical protein